MNDVTLPNGPPSAMPSALAIFLDDRMYQRCCEIALRMSKAEGMTPRHLLGKPEACFAIVERSLSWRLSPFAVAMSTYQTPGGSIGFEGKLVQAVIENSGHLDPRSGGVHYEFTGDWSKVQAKYTWKENNGKKYTAATWTDADAIAGGCGVIVSAQLRGEAKPRSLQFDLIQAQPRNSTLWATDPKTQLCYAAVRRFSSVAVPGLLMGVPFEDEGSMTREREIDVSDVVEDEIKQPRARAVALDYEQRTMKAAAPSFPPAQTVDTETGEVHRPAGEQITREREPGADEEESAPQGPALIVAPALKHLRTKLEERNLMPRFLDHFAIPDAAELPMAKVNEAMAWLSAAK